MDVFDAIRTVLAVRQYQDKPVPPDVIRQIVEAGRLTASASNKQPWHFIVVEDRHLIKQLGSLVTTGSYISQTPLVIVVAVEDTKWAVSDASRAIQSMILVAWAAGIGSNWTGFLGGIDQVKQPLGIPASLGVLAALPFGYSAQSTSKGKKNRKPLEEVASLNRYGQPFRP